MQQKPGVKGEVCQSSGTDTSLISLWKYMLLNSGSYSHVTMCGLYLSDLLKAMQEEHGRARTSMAEQTLNLKYLVYSRSFLILLTSYFHVNILLQPGEARHNTQGTELQEINFFSNAWQQVRISQSSSSVLTLPAERNSGNTKQDI